MAELEEIVKKASLAEMMKNMDVVAGDLTAIHGNQDEATAKLVTEDKDLDAVRAQLLRKTKS